jgi:hypothetical protein
LTDDQTPMPCDSNLTAEVAPRAVGVLDMFSRPHAIITFCRGSIDAPRIAFLGSGDDLLIRTVPL